MVQNGDTVRIGVTPGVEGIVEMAWDDLIAGGRLLVTNTATHGDGYGLGPPSRLMELDVRR